MKRQHGMTGSVTSSFVAACLTFVAMGTAQAETLATVPGADDPQAIVGGNLSDPCQWPSVVAMIEGDETPVMCTGSLIHPQVVMTAAHCVIPERPIIAVGFGEHGQDTGVPERLVDVIDCVGNPLFDNAGGADVGYCLLDSPVNDVPIVPLMAGCEVEQLVPGGEVFIIGFGADFGSYDPETDTVSASGVGPKRWTTQTIDFIDQGLEEINMFGNNGSQSACFGDSGGPGMAQLADGTWRVFGTGGHLYDPGGLPPPMLPDNICGAGAAYGFAPFVIDWLEQETGVDLTPCWNGEQWDPGPGCGNFPLDPNVGAGVWPTGCSGGNLGGGAPPACADVPPPPGDDSGGSDDASDTTGVGDTSGGDTTGSATTSPPPPPPPPADSGGGSSPPPLPGETGDDAGDESTGGEPGADDRGGMVDRGCSCRSTSGSGWGPAGLWVLLLAARRGRRRNEARAR